MSNKYTFLGDLSGLADKLEFGPLQAGHNDRSMLIRDKTTNYSLKACLQRTFRRPGTTVHGLDFNTKKPDSQKSQKNFTRSGFAIELPDGEDGRLMIQTIEEIERLAAERLLAIIKSKPNEFKKWKPKDMVDWNDLTVEHLLSNNLFSAVQVPDDPKYKTYLKPKFKFFQFTPTANDTGVPTKLHHLLLNGKNSIPKYFKDPKLSHLDLTRNSKVVMSVQIWGVWIVKEQFGIHMDIEELFIAPGKNEQEIGRTICTDGDEKFEEATEEEVEIYTSGIIKNTREEYEFDDNADHKQAKITDDGDY